MFVMFKADNSGAVVCALLLALVMLASGDFYDLVRDCVEARVFCPRYDKASQKRPTFTVNTDRIDVLCLRLGIYINITPLLPAAFLATLCYAGKLHLPAPFANAWLIGVIYSLLFGVFRVIGKVLSLRTWFEPFKRVPSPDIS